MKVQPQAIERFPDPTSLSTWRVLLAHTAPGALQTLIEQQPQLLPRFAAYYSQLQQLPRRVRRGLQRRFRRVHFTRRHVVRTLAPYPDTGAHPTRLPRSVLRQWERSVVGLALFLALGQAPAWAATIHVGGGCTLVDAITAANTNKAIGRCRAGSGADTIVLPAHSTQTLTQVNNQFVGPSGLPVVTSRITIAGNGSTIARSTATGTPAFRILVVGAGGKLTLRRTTVSGGLLQGDARGGGVYRQSGRLALDGCTISGNTAYLGGGVANGAAGTLTVTNSTISGNRATGNQGAGGVFNLGHVVDTEPGTLLVTNSTISGNTAKFGGGMRNDGVAILANSTISGNTVDGSAGGVANRASLTLTNSTIVGNSARYDGGGVWSAQGAANSQATVTLTNSTVSGNLAANRGAGLYNSFGHMTLINSTVARNGFGGSRGGGVFSGGRVGSLRSDVVLLRSLISGNHAVTGAEIFQADGGVVTANSSNLFGHIGVTTAQALSGFILSGASDITATSDGTRPTAFSSILDPALGNNGGPTRTHALTAVSPAVDAAATGCPLQNTDQRGVPRPQDGNNDGIPVCDIGAFERVP